EPAAIRFAYQTRGKPVLVEDDPRRPTYFNLSHSEDLCLVAVSRLGPVGVDVEKRRPPPNLLDIARRSFGRKDFALLDQLADPKRANLFLQIWTCKEAYLKATGEGLSSALRELDLLVPAGPGHMACRSDLETQQGVYQFLCLSPASDYVGAAAIRA